MNLSDNLNIFAFFLTEKRKFVLLKNILTKNKKIYTTMDNSLEFSSNTIAVKLNKKPADFTKADIIDFIKQENIRHVNFMYPAGDGRLKTLNFIIHDIDYLDEILTCGERVDGSSLFSFVEASSSDLYVVPRFRTAFVDRHRRRRKRFPNTESARLS